MTEKEEEEETPTPTTTPIPDVPLIPIKPNIIYVIDEDTLRNCINQENLTQCVLLNDIEINNNEKQWIVTSTFEGAIIGRNNKIIFKDPLSKSGFISTLNYTEIKDITFIFKSDNGFEFIESDITDDDDNSNNKYSGMLFNRIINSRLSNVEIIFNQTKSTSLTIGKDISFGVVAGLSIYTEYNRVTIDFLSPLEVTSKEGSIRRNLNEIEDIYTGLLLGSGNKVTIVNTYVKINKLNIVNMKNIGILIGKCYDCKISKSYTQTNDFNIENSNKDQQQIYSGIIANSNSTIIHNSFTVINGFKSTSTSIIIFGGIFGKASNYAKITSTYIDIRLGDNIAKVNIYGFIGLVYDNTITIENCRAFMKNSNKLNGNYINGNNNYQLDITKFLIDLKQPSTCEKSKIPSNKYLYSYIYDCNDVKDIKGMNSVSTTNLSISSFPGLDFTSSGYFKLFEKNGNIIYSTNNINEIDRILQDTPSSSTTTTAEEDDQGLFVGLSRLPNTIPNDDNITFTKVAASKYEVEGDCWDSDVWIIDENGNLIISREPEKRTFEIPITGLYPILKDSNKNSKCENNCNNHGICRRNECVCINNWTGKNCESRKCSYGNYHFNNTYNIIMECSGIGKCNREEGKCICPKEILESGSLIEVSYVSAESNTTNCDYIYSNI